MDAKHQSILVNVVVVVAIDARSWISADQSGVFFGSIYLYVFRLHCLGPVNA
jgi:hypothetical protein